MLTPKTIFSHPQRHSGPGCRQFFADRFAHIDDVPAQVLPDGSQCYHCNIETTATLSARFAWLSSVSARPTKKAASGRCMTMPLRPSNAKNWSRAKSRLSTPPAWPAAKNVILSAISAAPALPAPARLTARKRHQFRKRQGFH